MSNSALSDAQQAAIEKAYDILEIAANRLAQEVLAFT